MEAYIHRAGEQLGPYTKEELLEMFYAGQFLSDDQLWVQGDNQWRNANIYVKTKILSIPSVKFGPKIPSKETSPGVVYTALGVIVIVIALGFWKGEVLAATLGGGFMFIALALAAGIYFLPSIIAYKSNHKNALAIVLLNAFLGWTLIGWVAALVWSVAK